MTSCNLGTASWSELEVKSHCTYPASRLRTEICESQPVADHANQTKLLNLVAHQQPTRNLSVSCGCYVHAPPWQAPPLRLWRTRTGKPFSYIGRDVGPTQTLACKTSKS